MEAEHRKSGLHDDAEIARFNAIASQWWDPNGPMKPLHRLNPIRLSFLKREFCNHFRKDISSMQPFGGLKLLDIGCGAGLISEPMGRMGFSVDGIDLARENIVVAAAHAEISGLDIRYHAEAIENMPPEQGFDAITLLEVVEHVPDVGALIREAAMRLKPGGMLIASTLNRTLKAYALAIIGAEYVLRWLPRGTHTYEKFVTPDELAAHLAHAGLMPGSREGMVFNPLSNGWSLSADTDVNYLITATKPA